MDAEIGRRSEISPRWGETGGEAARGGPAPRRSPRRPISTRPPASPPRRAHARRLPPAGGDLDNCGPPRLRARAPRETDHVAPPSPDLPPHSHAPAAARGAQCARPGAGPGRLPDPVAGRALRDQLRALDPGRGPDLARPHRLPRRPGEPGRRQFDRPDQGLAARGARGRLSPAQGARLYAAFGRRAPGLELVREQLDAVDRNFFQVFDLPLVRGDRTTALGAPGSLVLTQAKARAYFGTGDPVGRSLRLVVGGQAREFRVTGVLATPPAEYGPEARFPHPADAGDGRRRPDVARVDRASGPHLSAPEVARAGAGRAGLARPLPQRSDLLRAHAGTGGEGPETRRPAPDLAAPARSQGPGGGGGAGGGRPADRAHRGGELREPGDGGRGLKGARGGGAQDAGRGPARPDPAVHGRGGGDRCGRGPDRAGPLRAGPALRQRHGRPVAQARLLGIVGAGAMALAAALAVGLGAGSIRRWSCRASSPPPCWPRPAPPAAVAQAAACARPWSQPSSPSPSPSWSLPA